MMSERFKVTKTENSSGFEKLTLSDDNSVFEDTSNEIFDKNRSGMVTSI